MRAEKRAMLVGEMVQCRPLFLDEFPADDSISVCRIAMDLLREQGVDIAPLLVGVAAMNAVAVEWINQYETLPTDDHPHIAEFIGKGGYMFKHLPDDDDDGHLVLVVPRDNVMVDLTADQYHDPAHGIFTRVGYVELPSGWKELDAVTGELPHNGRIRYFFLHTDKRFKDSAYWQPGQHIALRKEIRRRLMGVK